MTTRGRKRGGASDEASVSEAWRLDLERGMESLAAGEPHRAEAHFARAYRRAPDRPEVLFALGRERLREGRLEEAEPLLRGAWQKSPRLASAATALARCLGLGLGRLADAYQVIDEA